MLNMDGATDGLAAFGEPLPCTLNVRVLGMFGTWNSMPNWPGCLNMSCHGGWGIFSDGTNLYTGLYTNGSGAPLICDPNK